MSEALQLVCLGRADVVSKRKTSDSGESRAAQNLLALTLLRVTSTEEGLSYPTVICTERVHTVGGLEL